MVIIFWFYYYWAGTGTAKLCFAVSLSCSFSVSVTEASRTLFYRYFLRISSMKALLSFGYWSGCAGANMGSL